MSLKLEGGLASKLGTAFGDAGLWGAGLVGGAGLRFADLGAMILDMMVLSWSKFFNFEDSGVANNTSVSLKFWKGNGNGTGQKYASKK